MATKQQFDRQAYSWRLLICIQQKTRAYCDDAYSPKALIEPLPKTKNQLSTRIPLQPFLFSICGKVNSELGRFAKSEAKVIIINFNSNLTV